MAVPRTPHYREALAKGDTLRRRPHVHWVKGNREAWLEAAKSGGKRIVAVELVDDATPLAFVESAREPTVMLVGHEGEGVPSEVWPLVDEFIEIPMIGSGRSLNVAVAGSLVAYRLAGLA